MKTSVQWNGTKEIKLAAQVRIGKISDNSLINRHNRNQRISLNFVLH